jgi:CDP-diacylglycerol--glycerol-3-phosphate 3-phosphatidyltransferase/cardiolipin synthase
MKSPSFPASTCDGRYRACDLLSAPGILSLLRIPLGGAFVAAGDRPWAALAVLAAAGITDVADGWLARRLNMTSATGAALDAIADKLFAITVAVALVVRGRFSIGQILLLNARELGELPLLVWMLGSQRARRRRSENATSNLAGKATTVLQFAAIASALFEAPHTGIWAGATALVGACAAAAYWSRECRAIARDRPPRDESAHAA